MSIGGATIFSMKVSPTATKLDSVACVAFFTCVFQQMVAQTTFQVNVSFAKGSILLDWTDFSNACDFHCKNLRKTSKSIWNSVVWQGRRFWRWSMMHYFLMKRWHSCFQKVVNMHEFLCVKRYFCQDCLADTALNEMIQIILTVNTIQYFHLMVNLLHKVCQKFVISQ